MRVRKAGRRTWRRPAGTGRRPSRPGNAVWGDSRDRRFLRQECRAATERTRTRDPSHARGGVLLIVTIPAATEGANPVKKLGLSRAAVVCCASGVLVLACCSSPDAE